MMSKQSNLIPASSTLPDQIAMQLRRAIELGELKEGEWIPTPEELGDKYGVRPSVVRDAMSILRSEGLIHSRDGAREVVSQGRPGFHLQPNLGDRNDLAQLIEFLISVEIEYTALAAERCSDIELQRIKSALDDLGQAVREQTAGAREDMRFHYEILRASHNHYFIRFGKFLEDEVRRLIRTARENTARISNLVEDVFNEHEAIYEAIAKRDPAAAREAAGRHLKNAAARLEKYQVKI